MLTYATKCLLLYNYTFGLGLDTVIVYYYNIYLKNVTVEQNI